MLVSCLPHMSTSVFLFCVFSLMFLCFFSLVFVNEFWCFCVHGSLAATCDWGQQKATFQTESGFMLQSPWAMFLGVRFLMDEIVLQCHVVPCRSPPGHQVMKQEGERFLFKKWTVALSWSFMIFHSESLHVIIACPHSTYVRTVSWRTLDSCRFHSFHPRFAKAFDAPKVDWCAWFSKALGILDSSCRELSWVVVLVLYNQSCFNSKFLSWLHDVKQVLQRRRINARIKMVVKMLVGGSMLDEILAETTHFYFFGWWAFFPRRYRLSSTPVSADSRIAWLSKMSLTAHLWELSWLLLFTWSASSARHSISTRQVHGQVWRTKKEQRKHIGTSQNKVTKVQAA